MRLRRKNQPQAGKPLQEFKGVATWRSPLSKRKSRAGEPAGHARRVVADKPGVPGEEYSS